MCRCRDKSKKGFSKVLIDENSLSVHGTTSYTFSQNLKSGSTYLLEFELIGNAGGIGTSSTIVRLTSRLPEQLFGYYAIRQTASEAPRVYDQNLLTLPSIETVLMLRFASMPVTITTLTLTYKLYEVV